MNHIYRSIWNKATGAYAAVSENVKSAGKSSIPGSSGGGAAFALKALAASLMLGFGSLALAGPTGGTVVAGQAQIVGTPGSTTINQGSQNAVINWANFNIGANESVRFNQPNSNSVALNRVLGSDGTTILGNLSANGKVFIVNPNGILFGQGASVNTAGLVGSTLDISNADFMSGNYKFTGNGAGRVLNQGSISAPGGYVALLGANVSNEGTIQARLGSVALAAGRAITLDVAGDGLLNVTVDQGAVGALVSNGGLIKADGGNVLLSAQAAGDLLKTVVNNTGIIEAHTIDTKSGTIKLLGDMQSGTVNAAGTLDASAPTGGKGGFIDTSAAHVKLDDALKVTTASSKGVSGTWLIDPPDYTIAATGGDQTGAFFTNALKSTSVQIQSISGGSGLLGNINVNDTISWSANQLKLTAQNNININQPLRGSGTASLALEYGQQAIAASNLSTYNVKAEIDLPSGLNFSTKLGSDGTATVYTVINSLGAANSTTGTDLQGLKNVLSGNFVLGANIDATGTANTAIWGTNGFTSIGTNTIPFAGQFDGLGHVITGLNSSTTALAGVAGLFGGNTGSIRNIGLVAPVIAANISGTEGNIAALAATNNGTISNAYASGGSVTITTGAVGAGLVGYNTGTISDSYNSSKVSVGNSNGWMGGLVGNTTKTSTVINSYNTGEVVGAYNAGGLVGNNLGNITNSFNSGTVSGTINTGGITSNNRGTGVITNTFNTGAVTGNGLTGGLVGANVTSGQILNSYSTGAVTSRGTTGTGFGGLAGGNSGIIRNSYATGAVTGVGAVGGLVGTNTSAGLTENAYSSGAVSVISGGAGTVGGLIGSIGAGTSPSITGGYFNTTVNAGGMPGVGTNGGTTTPAITGLTSAQMRNASNFSAFTFTSTTGAAGNNWVMVNTDGTLNGAGNATGATGPMLAAEYSNNIYSSHQLQLMAMNLAGNYTLKQDINAASTGTTNDVWNGGTFVPVGTSTSTPFTGTFDGTGHVISGLVINRPSNSYGGLFGVTSSAAIVRNVGLEGGSVIAANTSGALVGLNLGLVDGSYSTNSVSGGSLVGGLVGLNGTNNGTPGIVSNSYASGAVSGTGIIGGLVGTNAGTLTNNYASGTVTGGNTPGGVTGSSNGTASGNFWDTTTSGMLTSGAGTGLSTAQMKLLSTYTAPGWNLASTWIVYDTNTYPLLRAFMTPLQVTFASNASKTYDGTNSWTAPSFTYSNPNASLSGSINYGAADSADNAGTYAITADGLYSGQRGYAISSNAATLTINRKAANLSGVSVVTRNYNGTTGATITGGTITGILVQDLSNIQFNTGTFDTKDAGTGKTVTAILSGSAGGNYIVSTTGLTGTITPKALTVSGLAATTKVYDNLASATVTGGTFVGLVSGETLNLGASSGTYQDANAGTNKTLTVTLGTVSNGSGLASNYSITAPGTITGTITPKALSWASLSVGDKEYDGNTTASISKATISGLVGGQELTTSRTATFADQNAGNNKTVTVHATLSDGGSGGTAGLASNYTFADATVTASITPKALTVSGAVAGNKTYDGTKAAAVTGGTLSGLVGSETVVLGALSGTFADQNAGNGIAVTVTGGTLSNGTNGGLASNYTVGSVTGLSANITQKALTVSGVTVASKAYDGGTNATISGGTLNGLVSGETLTLSGQSGTFSDQNAGNGKAVTVTGATLGNGTGQASNYTVSNATGATGNITRKALTVTGATAGDKVYDGGTAATVSGGALSGLVGSETLGLSSLAGAFVDQNAASGKTVTVSGGTLSDGTGGGLASNYTVGPVTGLTASITQKALTVSGVTVSAKAYDGNTKASLTGGTLNGLVAGETLSLSGQTGTFNNKDAGIGKAVTVTGTTLVNGSGLASNYSVTNPTGVTGDITQKALMVTGVTGASKVYDGTTKATITGGNLSGLVGGETLGLSGLAGAFADKNAGTTKGIVVTGATLSDGSGLASNYSVSNPTGVTANISQASISAVSNIVASDKVYDGNTKATVSNAGATFAGMVNGDALTVSATVAAFTDKNAGSGKTVNASGLTLGGTDVANYVLTATTGSGTAAITPKALTITSMTAGSKAYNGNTHASLLGGSISGLVGTESVAVSGLTAAFDNANAGTNKTVTVSGATLGNGGGGGLAANYTISNPTGLTATITPKALTVTGMTAGSKVYDGTTAATLAGGNLSGLVGSETLVISGSSGVFVDKNAGNGKAVTVSGVSLLDGTGLASNYTVSNPTGVTGTITQKALTVTGVTAGNKVYDGGTKASLSGGTLDGLVGLETLTLSGMSAVFDDKNAGTGKTVTVTGASIGDAGSGATAGLASNYTVTNATGVTANIDKKALTISGVVAGNKTYDGTTAAAVTGGTLNGLIGSETLAVSGAFGDKNAGTGKAVTVSVVDGSGGGLASNYALTSQSGLTANIDKKGLTVTGVTAGNKTYDGTDTAVLSGGMLDGLFGTETLTLTGQSGKFDNQNAGTGKTVTVTGATLGDAGSGATAGLASNYTVTNATGVTANIDKKALTISGVVAGNKTYDGTTAAAVTGGTLNGLIGGETLAVSGAFGDKNAGADKAVTVSVADGSGGGLASNYALTSPSGLTANIDKKGLTVIGVTAGNKTYDGTDTAVLSGGMLDGLVGTETLTLTGQSGKFDNKNAGTGKVVTVSGATLGDAGTGATAGLASNYSVTNATGVTANIAQKDLTVGALTAGNKVYDGTVGAVVNSAGATFDGMVAGDSLTASASGAFSDKNAATGKTVTIDGITLGGTDAGNYTLTSAKASTTADIGKAAISAVGGITAGNKVYDGTTGAALDTSGASFGGMVAGDSLTASASGAFSDKNAATGKTVAINGITLGGTDAGNYSLSSTKASTTADISKAAISAVGGITAGNKVYDGTTGAVLDTSGAAFGGMVAGDSLTASASGAFSDKNAATGKTVAINGITLGGTDAGNYTLNNTKASTTADISKAAITAVGGITAGNKVYDGTTGAVLDTSGATFGGMVAGDSLTASSTGGAFSDKNAATGKTVSIAGIALGGADAGNYTLTNTKASTTADITARALTLTGQVAGNKVYDGNNIASLSGGILQGLVGGETLNFGGQSAVFSDKNAGNGKAVTVSGTTLLDTSSGLASNYTVSNPTGLTASITPKALTVTGQLAGNKVYDGNAVASLTGGVLSGLVGGEALNFGGQVASFSDKNAANGKAVTVTGTTLLDTASGLASNYSVSNPTGLTASITPKALTVTGQLAGNKVYDGNAVASLTGGVLSGLVGSETLNFGGQVASFSDKNAANGKTVTVTGTTLVDTATGLASNYTVSNPTGLTASITPKALTVTGQLAGNKVYDGNAVASLTGGVLSGLVGGEALNFGGQVASFSDKNAANGKTVTVTGTTLLDTASGLASNYTVSNPTGLTASITPKALTVTGQLAGNKVYDGNAVASLTGGVLSGLVGSETLNFGGQSAVFSDKNAGNGKAVTVSGTILLDTSSGLASNYTVSNPTGLSASITPKALTLAGQVAGNKVYDGATVAQLSGGVLQGLVGDETLVVAGQNATFSDKNVGNGKTVTVTGTTLVDTANGLASNYTVSNPTGLSASITPKALTVTGQLAGNKVYDGNVRASLSGGSLSGLVTGETLGIAGQTATFADKNAANGKAVTVTGTTLVDGTGSASNYTVSNPTGLSASITPASLVVSATGASRVYDTTTNASVTLSDNRIAGDVLTIGNSGARFADKNAGAGKTVTVNGITLAGADAGNYIVNSTATTTASISQAALGVKVDNAEKDQGRVNPDFTATYTGLLVGDTLVNEVSGNLAYVTNASTASPSGDYLVSASGQSSVNYALTYTPGVLTVKPTEALQSALASVIGTINVAPSQGNMVQADMVATGERADSKADVVAAATGESAPDSTGNAPTVQLTGAVTPNILPGLRLNVIDTGLRLPGNEGNTSLESQ